MKYIAQLISVIFQPLMVPSILFLNIFLINQSLLMPFSNVYFYPFLTLIFLGTYLLPSVVILLFRLLKITDSYTLESKKDRLIAAVMVLFLWSFFIYIFESKYGFSKLLISVLVSACVVLFLATIINYFYRFSLHTFAISTLCSFLFFGIFITENDTLLYPLLISIFVAGLVGWARLLLQKHTFLQLTIGYFSGICIGGGFAYYVFAIINS
ncbi:MAG: hypothetical protein EAZ53_07795 [Bacteroidetes bacterium]|nr:MAG: hypothetical protein EAZ53_07795 [Bacteroidota bacterium]